jgi:diguanylate cyclase (GGDEF)-like protein
MPQGTATKPRQRRLEDQDLNLLLAQSPEAVPSMDTASIATTFSVEIRGIQVSPDSGAPSEAGHEPAGTPDDTVFLLDLGAPEAIVVAGGAVRRISRGEGGEDLLSRAAAGAAVWRRERLRTWKRAQLPEQLIAFAEQLHRANTETDVFRALIEYSPRLVGGFTAGIMLRQPGQFDLHGVDVPNLPYEVRTLSIPALQRLSRASVITREDARADTASPFSGLSTLMTDVDASVVAHVPFDNGILMLVDRRRDRVFGPEDWDLLSTLSRQASASLQRVRLFREVHSLSLADPLTGLANRRQMKVVLERGLAAARRGEGLAVVMFDLDEFKSINDVQGHLAGDRVLVGVAEVLQREARGADLVVRYGGDEFLVVMPGGTAQGASTFVRRVRERLAGQTQLSAGVAEFAPHITTVEQMIEAADRNLYLAKQRRRADPSASTPGQ